MVFNALIAATKLDIDPETMNELHTVFTFIYVVLGLITVAILGKMLVPLGYKKYKKRRKSNFETTNAIWFDSKESQLHRGTKHVQIEFQSYEYYVCKLTLENPNEYTTDTDVFDARSEYVKYKESERGVEQAVKRLNDKAVAELGIDTKLLKRAKQQTTVAENYRKHVKQL